MPQQNGCAERFNQTIIEKAQAMRFTACLPQSWWEFCVLHAVHLYNRTPSQQLNWLTPYEMLYGSAPDVSHFRVIGSGAYVFMPEEQQANKLAPRAELMTFIGFQEGMKGYLFMRTSNNSIFKSATALFNETLFPRCPDKNTRGFTPVSDMPPLLGENPIIHLDSDDSDDESIIHSQEDLPKRSDPPHDNDGVDPDPLVFHPGHPRLQGRLHRL